VRTWSVGKSQVKFRLRQYNDETIWWYEVKTNTQGMVDKTRRQVTPEVIDSLGMRPIVMVKYQREEYEAGSDALDEYEEGKTQALEDWLRITIDTGVTAFMVPGEVSPSVAMKHPGMPLASMRNRILEVKSGQNVVPPWLPLPSEWPGSKSRWAVAAKYNKADMWAPSYTRQNRARDNG